MPEQIRAQMDHPQLLMWMGSGCGLVLLVYWLGVLFRQKPLNIRGVVLQLPSPRLITNAVGCFDVALAGVVLWVLLADHVTMSIGTFSMIFVLAQVAGSWKGIFMH